MENVLKNESSEIQAHYENDSLETSQWNIFIEDLSAKDINAITNKDDVVFYRSSSSCSCTC